MNVLDRYLRSVGTFLPAEQKEDILRELSENIQSQVEEKEAELGRPLSEPEQEAILKQLGHPLVVASRYRHDQRSVSFGRQLIGPVLFPAYVRVLSWNLSFTFGILLIIFGCLLVAGEHLTISGVASVFFYQFLLQFGIITIIFSLVDRHIARHPDQWSVQRPNALPFERRLREEVGRDVHAEIAASIEPKPVSRFESISIMIASAGALAWLSAVRRNAFLIFGPAASILALGPVWNEAYPFIVGATFAGMVRAFINLVRPDWVRFRDLARIALDSAGLGILALLLHGRDWVVPRYPGTGLRAVGIINQWIDYWLVIGVIISGVRIVLDLIRLIRREVKTRPSHAQPLNEARK